MSRAPAYPALALILLGVWGCSSQVQKPDTAAPPRPQPPEKRLARPAPAELPHALTLDLGGGITMELVLIAPGRFLMGSEKGRPDEAPVHEVTLTQPFYLGRYKVTQAQYQALMGNNPSHYKGPKRPVEMLSWNDAADFCQTLSLKTGRSARLPTEAEWEYACRAGSTSEYCFGDDERELKEYAWFSGNQGEGTHPVGEKKPNAWGLYDMHGNVWEWCQDAYEEGYYARGPRVDPRGSDLRSFRLLRGGSWRWPASACRSATRSGGDPDTRDDFYGCRVVVTTGPSAGGPEF